MKQTVYWLWNAVAFTGVPVALYAAELRMLPPYVLGTVCGFWVVGLMCVAQLWAHD